MRASSGSSCWYVDGLRFSCKRCGECCRGEPGYVWVSGREVEMVAERLGMTIREFAWKYLRGVYGRVSLREMENGDCVLLGEGGCKVYEVRPKQCRTFPFWPENLRSRQRWEELGKRCPGVGEGELYSREEIDAEVGWMTDGERNA